MMAARSRLRFSEWRLRYRVAFAGLVFALVVLTVLLRERIFITIDAGFAGVQWSLLRGGTITEKIYREGMHVILPWNTMTLYDVRFQIVEETMVAMSQDGLEIETGIKVRFLPRPETLAQLHKHVGPDYVDVLIRPEVSATAREAIAKSSPSALYSAEERIDLQNLMTKKLSRRIGLPPEFVDTDLLEATLDSRALAKEERRAAAGDADSDDPKEGGRKRRKKKGKAFPKDEDKEFLKIEDLLITTVVLPATVAGSIEEKLRQEQADLEYVYRLQKEEKEEQRKIIESEGIAEFQRIAGVSLLKWKGLDASLELASAPNAELVFIGSRETGGLPVLLGSLPEGESSLAVPPPPGGAP